MWPVLAAIDWTELLKSPVVLLIIFVGLTLLSGGKLDVASILAMLQKWINPTAAAQLDAMKKEQAAQKSQEDQAVANIKLFNAAGDREGEDAARKLLDRLIIKRNPVDNLVVIRNQNPPPAKP